MKITQSESDLLKSLVAELSYPAFDINKHVTAAMLAEQLGIKHRTASNKLIDLKRQGKMKREKVDLGNGYRAWGYYKD